MINKYIELHEQFIELIGQYYNAHNRFMGRPSLWLHRDLVTIMLNLGRVIREIKKNNLEMRHNMRIQIKERKKQLAKEREEKQKRKTNVSNN